MDDLSSLFTMNLNSGLGLVSDSVSNNIKQIRGFKPEDYYYNSGIILFNLEIWRKNECQNRIENFMKNENVRFAAPDQDLINIVLRDEITRIPMKYNLQPIHFAFNSDIYLNYYKPVAYYSKNEIDEAMESPAILHTFRFLGEFPWNLGNLHPQNEYFDFYLKKSEWKDYEKKPSNISLKFKLEKLLYRILPKSIFLRVFNIAFNRYQKNIFNAVKNGAEA